MLISDWELEPCFVTCFSFLRLSLSLMFWSISRISSNSSMAFWEDASFCCSNSAPLIWWQNVWMGIGTQAESPPSTLETPSMGTWGQESGKTSVLTVYSKQMKPKSHFGHNFCFHLHGLKVSTTYLHILCIHKICPYEPRMQNEYTVTVSCVPVLCAGTVYGHL